MNLCLVTPTRKRWPWLSKQIARTTPQLGPEDKWVIVIDNDEPDEAVLEQAASILGGRLIVVALSYFRPMPEINCVTRAYNAGVAMAGASYGIVDVDDHDILERDAIEKMRAALDDGAGYVFGSFHQQALIPTEAGTLCEPWPDVTNTYKSGGFARGEIECIGVRAYSPIARFFSGPWSEGDWPAPDKGFAVRFEEEGIKILALPDCLCTVTICDDSLMANFRREPCPS